MTSRFAQFATAFLLASVALGCSQQATENVLVERVHVGQVLLAVKMRCEVGAARKLQIVVPGSPNAKQITWLVTNGTYHKEGEVIARFDDPDTRGIFASMNASAKKSQLAEHSKQSEIALSARSLTVDVTQTDEQLAIARRYAGAPAEIMSRNDLLDAVLDKGFLEKRSTLLSRRHDLVRSRGETELALITTRTRQLSSAIKETGANMEGLLAHALTDGIVLLAPDWSSSLPHPGGIAYGGSLLAEQPNGTALNIACTLPEVDADGINKGDALMVDAPWNHSVVTTEVSEKPQSLADARSGAQAFTVLNAALPNGPDNQWTIGQIVTGRAIIAKKKLGITIPLSAVHRGKKGYLVTLAGTMGPQEKQILVGRHDSARIEVLQGLREGDLIRTLSAASGE